MLLGEEKCIWATRLERALLRAVNEPNRLLFSQEAEDEYREVIFRPKFDRYVSIER
jgi:hypothetical protein